MTSGSSRSGGGGRAARVRALLDDCLRRRAAGESLPDEEMIADHPELMPELGRELKLLAVLERAARRAGSHTDDATSSECNPLRDVPPWPQLADGIPGYHLIREIHRGGQGLVYLATQQSTRRKVAVKITRGGPFTSEGDRARFEREVRILAQLRHPSIITIHDSGHALGCTYFVMNYVDGPTLSDFAREGWHPLDARRTDQPAARTGPPPSPVRIRELLSLFTTICDAVNAAHLRGVIHRDLKPSNIRIDADGQPHVLDFGLAKQESDADASLQTITGQFVGSLPWASPEQALGAVEGIDVRTDVYALGVILYQLLSGHFPYDVRGPMRAVQDRIVSEPPARPSLYNPQIDHELETILLRCLDKDRERRYQSAGALGRDIQRYLAGDPIEAKRDSVSYLLRKQLQRYRAPVMVAAAFVVLVTVGLLASLTFWRQAVAQRASAELNAERYSNEATKALAVSNFLQEMIASADPYERGDPDITVREMLHNAAADVDAGALGDQPLIEAAVRVAIGRAYLALANLDDAQRHVLGSLDLRQRELGAEHLDVAEAWLIVGQLREQQGAYDAALDAFDEALAIRQNKLDPADPAIAECFYHMANLYPHRGTQAAAEDLYRRALAIWENTNDPSHQLGIAACLHEIGVLRKFQDDCETAAVLFDRAIDLRRDVRGDDHPLVAESLDGLARTCLELHDYERAEPLFREALQIRRHALGDDHPEVAAAIQSLALCLQDMARYDDAVTLLEACIDLRSRSLGAEHMYVNAARGTLGRVFLEMKHFSEAEAIFRQNVDWSRKRFGPASRDAASSLCNLGRALMGRGEYEEAERYMRQSVEILRQNPRYSPSLATALSYLATLLLADGRPVEAEACLRESLDLWSAGGKPGPIVIGHLHGLLGEALLEQKRLDEAETLLVDAYASGETLSPRLKHRRRRWAGCLATLHEARGDRAAATLWRDRARPPDDSP